MLTSKNKNKLQTKSLTLKKIVKELITLKCRNKNFKKHKKQHKILSVWWNKPKKSFKTAEWRFKKFSQTK
jgi:hypothetical protein